MRVALLTNSSHAASLVDWLRAYGDDVTVLQVPLSIDLLKDRAPEYIVSYNYAHIVPASLLEVIVCPVVNLHISLLPHNRGADPNVWSFINDTPKGVTVHAMDAGIDTGPVLLQSEIFFDERAETLASSYHTLQQTIQGLFKRHWPELRANKIAPRPQTSGGSVHRREDFLAFREILKPEGYDISILDLKIRYEEWRTKS